MEYFQSKVGLSEITIQRLVLEIDRIFQLMGKHSESQKTQYDIDIK
jgi:hypothetical protein